MEDDVAPASRPASPQTVALESAAAAPQLSKRAARRLIQRALVLVGRDPHVRQHVREASVRILWILEDWRFAWTVVIERGKIRFERRPAKKPDLTFNWRTANGFFRQIETGAPLSEGFEMTGNLNLRRFSEPVYQAFSNELRKVLRYPFDEDGEPLT